MRGVCWGLVLAVVAAAQEIKGPTREAKDPEGRITVTVPSKWADVELAGSNIIRVKAPGSYGGHDLMISREEGQDDVDKQRDRYLDFDSANHPNATVKKMSKPYFGYRLNAPDKNRVLIRSFLTDGTDGLVISCSSRFQHYDKVWAKQIEAIVASVKIKGGAAQQKQLGEERRLYDKQAAVSVVVPGVWKPITPETEKVLLFVALKGARKGPRFRIEDMGTGLSPGLVLLKISGQWKKAYGGVNITKLGTDPDRMMIKNRREGWIDYFIAFENNGRGYTLQMTCREGSFEKFRDDADRFYKTIAFSGGKWTPPVVSERELKEPYKKLAVLHSSVDQTNTVDAVKAALPGFFKHWPRVAPAYDKKGHPLQLVLVADEEFKKASHYFGKKPVAYDRSTRVIVVAPRPKEESTRAYWRGRLYWALAEAALHRDLPVTAPIWLQAGLCACMEAAGRSGKSPEAPHDAYVDRLVTKTSTDAHMGLQEILEMTAADVDFAETPDKRIQAWGYVHLMLFGKSALGAMYRKWARALKKARGHTPKFDLKKFDQDKEDLKKHAFKNWEKK